MWSGACVRVTEARRLRMGAHAWGALPPARLLHVKLEPARASALLAADDVAGRASLLLQGDQVRHVLGLAPQRWADLQQLARDSNTELFYRPFKNGINEDFPIQQKLFYHLCANHQSKDLLFVSFKRVPNVRKGEKTIPFLQILECSKPTPKLIGKYREMYNDETII